MRLPLANRELYRITTGAFNENVKLTHDKAFSVAAKTAVFLGPDNLSTTDSTPPLTPSTKPKPSQCCAQALG